MGYSLYVKKTFLFFLTGNETLYCISVAFDLYYQFPHLLFKGIMSSHG